MKNKKHINYDAAKNCVKFMSSLSRDKEFWQSLSKDQNADELNQVWHMIQIASQKYFLDKLDLKGRTILVFELANILHRLETIDGGLAERKAIIQDMMRNIN